MVEAGLVYADEDQDQKIEIEEADRLGDGRKVGQENRGWKCKNKKVMKI